MSDTRWPAKKKIISARPDSERCFLWSRKALTTREPTKKFTVTSILIDSIIVCHYVGFAPTSLHLNRNGPPAKSTCLSMLSSIGSAVASSSRTVVRSSTRRITSTAMRSFATTGLVRNAPAPVDAKISTIVDQIEKLTLLEAADLVSHLKTRLNITEIAMPAASASAAAPAAAAGAAEPEEEAAKPKEKTVFTLKLTGLKDPTAKAKVIREVKAVNTTMNLVEAKKFVESTPQVLKEGLNKEDADKLKAAIEAAGGTVELE